MTEAIRRLNQLESGLERIEDFYVRESFSNLIEYVRSMQGDGVFTQGVFTGKDISLSNGVKSGGGILEAQDLNLFEGGYWRTKYFVDNLATATKAVLPVNGDIIGWVGQSESTDSGASGGNCWYPIERGSWSDRIFITDSIASNKNETDRMEIYNTSGSTLGYRVLIFYRGA